MLKSQQGTAAADHQLFSHLPEDAACLLPIPVGATVARQLHPIPSPLSSTRRQQQHSHVSARPLSHTPSN